MFLYRCARWSIYGKIMELVGFLSRNAVSCLIDRFVAAGLVTKDFQGKHIPIRDSGEVMAGTHDRQLWFCAAPNLDTVSCQEHIHATECIRLDADVTYIPWSLAASAGVLSTVQGDP
jgi:hypothetical protein